MRIIHYVSPILICSGTFTNAQEQVPTLNFDTSIVDQFPLTPGQPDLDGFLGSIDVNRFGENSPKVGMVVRTLDTNALGQLVRVPGTTQARDRIDFGYVYDQLEDTDPLGAALAAQAAGTQDWVRIATTDLENDIANFSATGQTDELAKAIGLMSQAQLGGFGETPLTRVELDIPNSQTTWTVGDFEYVIPLQDAPATELMRWVEPSDIPALLIDYEPENSQDWQRILGQFGASNTPFDTVDWENLRDEAISSGSYPQLDRLMQHDPTVRQLLSFEFTPEARIQYLESVDATADSRLQLGEIYHDQGNIPSAISNYRSALTLEPDNLAAQIGLAQIAVSPTADQFNNLPNTEEALDTLRDGQLAGNFDASITLATAGELVPPEARLLASVTAQEQAISPEDLAVARSVQSANCRENSEAGNGAIKCQFFDIAYITNRAPVSDQSILLDFGTTRVDDTEVSIGILRNDLVIARTIPEDQPGLVSRGGCVGLGVCVPVEVLLPEASDTGFEGIGTQHSGGLEEGIEASYQHFVERGSSDPDRALVFIHGFNTDFREAVDALTNLMITARYPSTPFLVSWPSEGRLWENDISEWRLRRSLGLNYEHDRRMVTESCTTIHNALSAILQKYGAGQVDLVIHSMGNQLFFEMLNGCGANQLAWPVNDDVPFRYLILSAPDVAVSSFQSGLALYASHATKTFIYGTENDLVLRVSRYVNRSVGDQTDDEINRLGFFDRPPLDADHVNWINTITVDGASQNAPLNHSHYVNTAPVRKDIAMILNGHDDDGAERCIFPASQEGFFFISPNCL